MMDDGRGDGRGAGREGVDLREVKQRIMDATKRVGDEADAAAASYRVGFLVVVFDPTDGASLANYCTHPADAATLTMLAAKATAALAEGTVMGARKAPVPPPRIDLS